MSEIALEWRYTLYSIWKFASINYDLMVVNIYLMVLLSMPVN